MPCIKFAIFSVLCSVLLGACGGGGSGSDTKAAASAPAMSYSIKVAVSGLTTGTLVLQNNGADNLSLTSSGSATFATQLATGANYSVSLLSVPSSINCVVSGGTGTVSAPNVSSIAVDCVPHWGTKQMGVTGADTVGVSVATDASGNVYVAGQTNGNLDGNMLSGTTDFFVTKYNSGGVKQFTQQLGATGVNTYGNSVATDASGNFYVAGYATGGLDGNTLTGTSDFFVTKYDSSGVKQFTRQLGVTGVNTFGYSVATDASGNVYVSGETFGGLDGNTLSGMGSGDFFVTKYDSSGAKLFTRQLGAAVGETIAVSVATDTSGNFYVAGYTESGLDGNTQMGTRDIFVTKYNSSGVKQFTNQLGAVGAETSSTSIATDAFGNVYVAGVTNGGLDGNTLTGTYDFFVTKYNSIGAKQFTRQMGVAGAYTEGNSVATDSAGNFYIAGGTSGSLDGNTLIGIRDFFITKYSSGGVKQFTRQLGIATTFATSVATDATNNAYVVGGTNGGLDGNALTGNYDFFVTKYNSIGVKQ